MNFHDALKDICMRGCLAGWTATVDEKQRDVKTLVETCDIFCRSYPWKQWLISYRDKTAVYIDTTIY